MTPALPADHPHPLDGRPLLGPRWVWSVELGLLGGTVSTGGILMFLWMVLALNGYLLNGEIVQILAAVLTGMGGMGVGVGAVMGARLWGLLHSRWPLPLAALRVNLWAAGALWGGLTASGGFVLSTTLLLWEEPPFSPQNLALLLSLGGLGAVLGGLLGAVLAPILVHHYLLAWLDRQGRWLALVAIGTTATFVTLGAECLTLAALRWL